MQLKDPIPSLDSESTLSLVSSAATVVSPQVQPNLPSLTLSADIEAKQVLVTINPPMNPQDKLGHAPGRRAPLDICCVIDVSGSMGTEAPIPADPTTNSPAESTGLSVLDVVKHALRTIMATMQDDDRIALVTFSDTAKVVSGLTEMTPHGRTQVLAVVEDLRPLDCTNLWDGLKVGMDLLTKTPKPKAEAQKSSIFSLFKSGKNVKDQAKAEASSSSEKAPVSLPSSDRFSTLFILTDGMPNINPPRGHIPMLKAYLNGLDNSHTFNISTFGFGYSLDSPLLLEIAQVGGGGYSFIPDSGIVGTVFVNAVANAYATHAPRVRLDVEIPDGNTVAVKGGLSATKTSWGIQILAGDLQFGQTMDVVLVFSEAPEEIAVTLNYRPSIAREDRTVSASLSVNKLPPQLAPVKYHAARLEFVEILWSINHSDLAKSVKLLEALAHSIITSPILANHSDALALEKDVSGEGTLALEPANYSRWGKHYLPSLARSHQRQQCGNFKDPGLQVYGRDSKIFIEERDKLDAAFMALPPPKPSVARSRPFVSCGSGITSTASRAPLKSMKAYYSSSGPCFSGDCLVMLPGGECMKVEELKRGVEVQTLTGTNKVAAVLRTTIHSGEAVLCRIDRLKITPWHPIVSPSQSNNWVFPADVSSPELMECDAVYSVLLLPPKEEGDVDAHSISVAGAWCVTLGHGLTRGHSDVRCHTFLGDYAKVLRELSGLEGFFGNGVVNCVGTRRDSSDGSICGFVAESEVNEIGKQAAWSAQNVLCA